MFNRVYCKLVRNPALWKVCPIAINDDAKSVSGEAFVQRCSVKKVFLEISQNSQENTWKRDSGTGVFLWILRSFKEHLLGTIIKHVGGAAGGFYKFFKKFFVAQETIDLNISRPSSFFRKYFMAPLINFSFLFKAYL